VIKENLLQIKERIKRACAVRGRKSAEITLVCVVKNRSFEEIQQVLAAGIMDLGENKVQEALLKYKQLSAKRYPLNAIKMHMIGHLQTNKVREAVKLFDLIHSVDSLRLAEEINKQALAINKIQDILIEVNISGEKSKFGVNPGSWLLSNGVKLQELSELVKAAGNFKNVRLMGLMAMAPEVTDPECSRIYFRRMHELLGEVNAQRSAFDSLRILSMGMSGDFEIAIEEGATMVRIGQVVFGDKCKS